MDNGSSFVLSTSTFDISTEDLNLDTDMRDVLTQLSSVQELSTILGDPTYDNFEKYTQNDNFGASDISLINMNVYDNNLIVEAGLNSKHYSTDVEYGLDEFKEIIKGRKSEESLAKPEKAKVQTHEVLETAKPDKKPNKPVDQSGIQAALTESAQFLAFAGQSYVGNYGFYTYTEETEKGGRRSYVIPETVIVDNELLEEDDAPYEFYDKLFEGEEEIIHDQAVKF